MQRKYIQYYLIFLILLFAGGLIPQITTAQDTIELPDVVKLNLEEAWSILNEKGFSMSVAPELNTRYEPGMVFEQNPAAGKTVLAGTTINLKVATGAAEVEVPDLRGQPREKARGTLQNKRLSIIATLKKTIKYENGAVFEQDPPPGKQVPVGTPVRLSIADVPRMVEIPVLVGRSLGEARAILDELDLSMAAMPELTEDHLPGAIFEQNPAPGTRVPITTPVYLKIAIASDLVEVPDVTGKTFETAWNILSDSQLTLAADPAFAAEYPPGSVFGQSVAAGSKVPIGTPVTLRIATSAEKVTVPNLRGQSFEETQAVLQNAGLPMAITTEVNSDFVPGTIMEQSLTAGSMAANGTPVFIKVALGPGNVTIPNLMNRSLEEAGAIFQKNKLSVVINTEDTDEYPPGTIIEQSIAGGSQASVGALVYLKVARGAALVEVPTCDSLNIEQAHELLAGHQLPMVAKLQFGTDNIPGTVLKQNPPAGSQVAAGTPVYFEVAVGADSVVVPMLAGKPFENARGILADMRLPMIVLYEQTDEYEPGSLFEQITLPGSSVPIGAPVYIKMALGRKEIEVPNLVGQSLEEVRSVINDFQLTVVLIPESATEYQPGTIFEQSLSAGSRVPAGTPILLKTAASEGTIGLPNLTGLQLKEARELLQEAGLQPVFRDSTTEEQPSGTVLRQSPRPGSEVEAGTSVFVIVAAPRTANGPPGFVAHISKEPKGLSGLLYFVAGILLILGIAIVSIRVLKRRRPSEDKHPKEAEIVKESVDGKQIDVKFEIHFETFADMGRQYIETNGVLILREEEGLTVKTGDSAPADEAGLPGEIDLADIEEFGARITELLKSSSFSTFRELEKALKFKIGLKPFPDAGKQSVRIKGSLVAKDNLKRIEGIGPKISEILRSAGIITFVQLASADVKHLREILDKADLQYMDPATWPEQAALAAEGKWDALKTLQKELKGGRRI